MHLSGEVVLGNERATNLQLAEHLRDFDCEEASGVFDQVMKQCSSWVPAWLQVRYALLAHLTCPALIALPKPESMVAPMQAPANAWQAAGPASCRQGRRGDREGCGAIASDRRGGE